MRVFLQLSDGEQLQVSHVIYKSGGNVHISTTYRGEACSSEADSLDGAINSIIESIEKLKREEWRSPQTVNVG